MKRLLSALSLLLIVSVPALAQETRPTLDKIKETGTLSLGYRENSAPYSFLDKDRKPAGYSVDLCARVAAGIQQRLGLSNLKVTWLPVTPATRVPQLIKGAIDLECGSTTITFTRMEQVDFSHMIFVDGGSLLATAQSGIGGVSGLGGKRVGIIPGTTTEKALAAALKRSQVVAQVVTLTDHGEGLAGLESGKLDAYATDRVLLLSLLARAKDPAKFALSDELYSYEPYGLMMRRGDNAFRVQVNFVLSALYRTGEIVPVYEAWFGKFQSASPLVQALYLLHSLPE
jgi:glutamate/aspartate transport system substrate-binding protein